MPIDLTASAMGAIPLEGFAIASTPITPTPTHLSPAEPAACNTS